MPSEPYVATVRLFQDPPAPYTPREGDVIERGRWRVVANTIDGSTMHYTSYKRAWLTGHWWAIKDDWAHRVQFAALVNHMGWRLLPRSQEPIPGKPDDPTPKKSTCVR